MNKLYCSETERVYRQSAGRVPSLPRHRRLRGWAWRWLAAGAALAAVAGCAPASPGFLGQVGGADAPKPAQTKTLTVAAANYLRAFGGWSASASGGALTLAEIHTDTLVTTDLVGNRAPRLAASLPSLDDGSIIITPDGRMQTTFRLRPDAKWHDGTPLTSADVAFTWQALAHPEIPFERSLQVLNMERVDTPDPLTAVIIWKTTFYRPLELGVREFWLMPKHLLEGPFQRDKAAFVNLPYWTTEYIHTGPFRLVDFQGETQVFERFDAYFLGRSKVDRIVYRAISDPNAVLSNLKAGALDIVTEGVLPDHAAIELRDEWKQSGAGTVLARQGNWRIIVVQFNTEWGRPPELSRDVRVRRGLLRAIDRDALREVLLPGVPDTEGHTFMLKSDPRAPLVGEPFARYRYAPSQAAQDFADTGWRRGPDGRLVNAVGQLIQIELRGGADTGTQMAIVADYWRRLGLAIDEEITPAALARDREYGTKFPGVEVSARGAGDTPFGYFDSRRHATAQNGWSGANRASYTNSALDRLLDRLYATIDDRQQGLILREIGDVVAEDLPMLPTHFNVKMAVVAKGAHALHDDYLGAAESCCVARNAYLWDRD